MWPLNWFSLFVIITLKNSHMSYAASDLYVRQGRDVTIPCMLNVTQSNIESLVWQKITNKITNSTQGSDTLYTFVNETSRVWQSPLRGYVVNLTDLVLLNVSLSHDGVYKCQILTQSALQPIESETYLHVILPLLEIEVRKTGTVINNGEIIELLHGEETDVECAVVGNVSPSVELRWVTSEDHNQTDGSTAMHHGHSSSIKLHSSRIAHEDSITCRAVQWIAGRPYLTIDSNFILKRLNPRIDISMNCTTPFSWFDDCCSIDSDLAKNSAFLLNFTCEAKNTVSPVILTWFHQLGKQSKEIETRVGYAISIVTNPGDMYDGYIRSEWTCSLKDNEGKTWNMSACFYYEAACGSLSFSPTIAVITTSLATLLAIIGIVVFIVRRRKGMGGQTLPLQNMAHGSTAAAVLMDFGMGGQTLPLQNMAHGSTAAAVLMDFVDDSSNPTPISKDYSDTGRDEASKTIHPLRGGTIQLPHHGISLCIPALALQRKCKITLKVLPKPSGVLFAEDEAIVSPGVVCEPSGTTFALPLKLVIPHCAVLTDPSKAKVTMYVTHGDKNVTKEELSLTGTPRCVVRKDDLEVYINHFSICEMFMVISDYLIGKRVASTPFLPKSMSRLQPQHCHLRLYNDTPGLEDLIETEEEKLDYRKMAPTKKMFVLWEKGELKIRCEVDSGHVTENEKTVSLDDIYRLDRNIVSFLVKATGDADVYFKFNFHPHCDEGHAFKANFSDGDIATNALPAIPIRLDDKLLYDIAEEIETDEHLDRLMQTLEVTQGSQSRYHELNRLEGHLTARGTRQMLMDWRARTAVIEQRDRLKEALNTAGLLDLRDRFLPG